MSRFVKTLFSNRSIKSGDIFPILCINRDLSIQVICSAFALEGNLFSFPSITSSSKIFSCVSYNLGELEIGITTTVLEMLFFKDFSLHSFLLIYYKYI